MGHSASCRGISRSALRVASATLGPGPSHQAYIRAGRSEIIAHLRCILVIGTVLITPVVICLAWWCLPETFPMGAGYKEVKSYYRATSIMLGLSFGLIIGYVTVYYTWHSYTPVREIAETQKQSAAAGFIYSLARGYHSSIVPVICLGVIILGAHTLCGTLGWRLLPCVCLT